MLRDFASASLAARGRASRTVIAALIAALATGSCGIKGPLRPAPATKDRPPVNAVPAPNAPAPAQEPPPPVEPRVAPKS